MKIILATTAILLASQAHALSAYSIGGDASIGGLTYVATFDAPNAPGVVETDTGPAGSVGLHTGSSGSAATPAGDTSVYEAVQPGGTAKFDLTGYGDVGALSVYIGSIDAYNAFTVSTSTGNYYFDGSDFLKHNGDQGSVATNRRAYFFAAPGQSINSISFRSSGVAFEYDSIAAGPYQAGQGVLPEGAEVLLPTAVPEPMTWALMTLGLFGMGATMRARRGALALTA